MHRKHDKIQELLEDFRDELQEPDRSWSYDTQRVVTFINKHRFDRRLGVKWLKEQCNVNGKNFSGRFRYYVGKTPRQYWIAHRIGAAKLLLQNESLADVPLIDIALSLGFRSHSSFSMTFKNYEAISPSNFSKWKFQLRNYLK